MSDNNRYIQLRRIAFSGPKKSAELELTSGVNVICGASDTGKSFLAESIDFMLGGSKLREIPQRTPYGEISFDLEISSGESWRLKRATSGGNFSLYDLDDKNAKAITLNQRHSHDKTNNLSGFLLDQIGLLGRRILKSGLKGTTQSLSFRNIARLIIVQETEIQQTGSPFWGGQYTLKTAELATIKLLLTGVDDSGVVSSEEVGPDNAGQIALLDELLSDLETEISDIGESQEDLLDQITRLESSIEERRESLAASQRQLNDLLTKRRKYFEDRQAGQSRFDEITDLVSRFKLLSDHYKVDLERLTAIQESGSMFAHVEAVPCPLCGAKPDDQHLKDTCDGDVDAIISAASAEIEKIRRLQGELSSTVSDLIAEGRGLHDTITEANERYEEIDKDIQQAVAPEVSDLRSSFSSFVETRASTQKAIELYSRREKLEARKIALQKAEDESAGSGRVATGLPDSVAHAFSMRVSAILKAWNFPGDCHVHFDKETTDFVIDGKPRGSRGKGLRAITHAAVTIGLLEYCQENELPHPGFVVLDSPLLAYFKPEGDDDIALQGTDLKERFYRYLTEHHTTSSQVIVIENQHPPSPIDEQLSMTVFTGNPNEGRFGFL